MKFTVFHCIQRHFSGNLVYLDLRVTSATVPVVSSNLLLMDLVVTLLPPLVDLLLTEMVVFWPVTVSAPLSSSSLQCSRLIST